MFLTASVEMKLGKIIGDLGLLLLHSRHRCWIWTINRF